MEFGSIYHLISVHFRPDDMLDCYDVFFHIFPVPDNPISFRPCHGICILSCGCVGVSVRRYCCGFRSMSLKIGYRTLNCILHFWSLILVSIFFAWGLLKIFSKSFLLQLFCLLIPIWNLFVLVVIVIGFCLSEWYIRLCESWAGVR